MKFNRTTKSALFTSVVSLFLCFTMLLGTTFAWFTDSATSAGNKIVAGTLNVDLLLYKNGNYTSIKEETAPIFGDAGLAQNDLNTLWEPGKTQVAYLAIENDGSLDLAYKVNLAVTSYTKNLYEAMEYIIVPDAHAVDDPVAAGDLDWDNGIAVVPGVNTTEAEKVTLEKDATHYFALVIHMNEDAGNEYQGGEITFDINVLATQINTEEGSLGSDYDKDATFPRLGTGVATVVAGKTSYDIPAYNSDADDHNKEKVGNATVPAAAVADDAETVSVTINRQQNVNSNVTVAAGKDAVTYDIRVGGLKEGNTEPVEIEINIAKNLDPATVEIYHYGTKIDSNYNPNTGIVSFESATFSPFTVVFDAESEYVAPEVPVDPENPEEVLYPKAVVEYAPDFVGEDKVQWGSYGQWSPSEGLSDDLEAAFTFSCPEDLDPAVEAAFEYWNCDFYVSLDRDLGANQIFLGGYYASFGAYVGFHNGDYTLAAGEELPLLGSVTKVAWTYADIRDQVGTFVCGVGDVNDALDGATFTVKLRLTNPANEAEFYDVNVVTYTFGGNSVIDGVTVVTTAEGLQDAVNGGDTNIQLGGDIDLSQGIVIPGN